MSQNPDTVKLLTKLKKKLGLRFDYELAEALGVTPQELANHKSAKLSKLTRGLLLLALKK
jgi:hypothetical protein